MVVDESVSVGLVNNIPKYLIWKGKDYRLDKIGFHHSFYQGKVLYHIFSVVAGTVFFKLKLNTENLLWRLEEVTDAI
jgi:hypothetical protein